MGGNTDGGRDQHRRSDHEVTAVDDGRFLAALLRANQLLSFGLFEEADEVMAAAAGQATTDDDVAQAGMARASLRFWQLADLTGAHAVLDELAGVLGDRPAADVLVAQRAVLDLFTGRTARALVRCRGVDRRDHAPAAARSLCASVAALARGARGEVGELAFADGPPPTDRLRAMGHGLCSLSVAFGRAANGLDPATADGPALPVAIRAAIASTYAGSAGLIDGTRLLWAGRAASAATVLEKAVTSLRHSDRARMLPSVLGQLAYARALLGDAAGARRAGEDAAVARHALSRLDEFFVGRGQAWAAAVRGELSAAREHLAAVGSSCERLGQPALAAEAWHDVARLGDPARAAPRLQRLAGAGEQGAEALVPRLAAHADALVTGDAGAAGAAAGRFRARGHLLHAAEAAAQAAALQRRHRADAERWLVTARGLADRCERASTPALAPLVDLDLTPREREVVGLVARGLSNRDIADRLHLSVRTVANHLQSSYGKLGVHRRAELVARHLPGAG